MARTPGWHPPAFAFFAWQVTLHRLPRPSSLPLTSSPSGYLMSLVHEVLVKAEAAQQLVPLLLQGLLPLVDDVMVP